MKTEGLPKLSRRGFLRVGGVATAGLLLGKRLESVASHEVLGNYEYLPAVNPGWAVNRDCQVLLDGGYIERLRQLGSRVMRVELGLGAHDEWVEEMLVKYEEIVRLSHNVGMEVSLVVDYETLRGDRNEWNDNSIEAEGGNGRNEYISRFVETTALLVDRLGGDRIEVWNEPAAYPHSYLYPSIMARLLISTYDAVKEARPEMEVVYGGDMSGAGTGYLRRVMYAGRNYYGWQRPAFDSLGYHLYHPLTARITDSGLTRLMNGLRSVLPADMPIRITEAGWESLGTEEGEQLQAENLVTLYQFIDQHPEYLIRECNWFCHHDFRRTDVSPLETWGLIDEAGRHKPAFEAFMARASLYGE